MMHDKFLEIMSERGFGVILLSSDNVILSLNDFGDRLLRGNGTLLGKPLTAIMPLLSGYYDEASDESDKVAECLITGHIMHCKVDQDGQNMIIFRALCREEDQKSEIKGHQPKSAKYKFSDIVYNSLIMANVIDTCKMIAGSDSSVMIYGETGTGKELISQSIHNASRRADGHFLAINCAAIPDNLLESLLFGTEKGAYTGAENRAGLLEQASGGTLLLDEINSMNMILQSKLLRVLQEGKVRRVGGSEEIDIDLRIISNINMPPEQAIDEGKLRRDLYYRLGVINVNLPPLRERKEDLALLAGRMIAQLNRTMNKNVRHLDANTLEIFMQYDWPGNIRELRHAIEHAMNLCQEDETFIVPQKLPEHILEAVGFKVGGLSSGTAFSGLDSMIQNVEVRAIIHTLTEYSGNLSKTASVLGISRQTLQYRMKKAGIDFKAFKK